MLNSPNANNDQAINLASLILGTGFPYAGKGLQSNNTIGSFTPILGATIAATDTTIAGDIGGKLPAGFLVINMYHLAAAANIETGSNNKTDWSVNQIVLRAAGNGGTAVVCDLLIF